MKLKLWQYCLITIFFFTSIIIAASPSGHSQLVAADSPALQWLRLNTPQNGAPGHYVLMNNSEVSRIAVSNDNKTIYALDNWNTRLYKSNDAGYTWQDLTTRLNAAPGLPGAYTALVALATPPDDPNFVAVAGTAGGIKAVSISADGGINWGYTGPLPTTVLGTIRSLDVAKAIPGGLGIIRNIAVSTANDIAGGTVARLEFGSIGGWVDTFVAYPGATASDVTAIKFSPNFLIDRTLLAVCQTATRSILQAANFGAAPIWNTTYTGYPINIDYPPGTATPNATQIITSDMALPSDYIGTNPSRRRVYIGFNATGGIRDAFRIDNTSVFRLNVLDGANIDLTSIAYYGTYDSGKLLAGRTDGIGIETQVYRTFNPQSRLPDWKTSAKPPTGPGKAFVRWAPDGKSAFCGTSGVGANDESAFSRSIDAGLSWNQTGIIDTVINRINHLEPSPNGDTLFMTTINVGAANADSLWRSINPIMGKWERVLARSSTGTGDNPRAKVAPDYADTKIVWFISFDISLSTQQLLVSYDGGNTFEARASNIVLIDLAVEDKNTLYGLNASGAVSKSVDGGWTWQTPVMTGLDNGYSITTAYTGSTPDNDKGKVIVGGTGTGNYDVAYSIDGGATFTSIPLPLPAPRGNTLVLASSGYKMDGTILAMTADGIYAWGIYAGKNVWEQWGFTSWGGWDYGFRFTGIVIFRNYTAYASTLRTLPWGTNGVGRWFYPNLLANLDPDVSFQAQPRGLKLSGGLEANQPVVLWAADTRAYNPPQGGVWYYADTLIWLGPPPAEPVSQAIIEYDPVTGRAGGIFLKWQPRSLADGYQIQIAVDEDFAALITDIGRFPYYYPHDPLQPTLLLPAGGGTITDRKGNSWAIPALPAGKTYYWRVRVRSTIYGDSLMSPWSWRESLAVKTGVPVRSPSPGLLILSPKIGATDVPPTPAFSWIPSPGTTKYEFVLYRDAALTDIIVKAIIPTSAWLYPGKLEPGKTYFWQVRAIEPAFSDWSAIGVFTTTEEATSKATQPLPTPQQPKIPPWIWLTIVLFGLTWGLVLILFLKSRHWL